jgi:predicted HD phosphohydrolase
MISRLAYRSRQFWNALLSPRKKILSEDLLPFLTQSQLDLFRRMHSSEQSHAYQVFKQLKISGQTDPDLLAAALLHDAGKILHPLSMLERVEIVIGKGLFRDAARRWAEGTPHGLRRPFVVAAQHAEWGADLASRAGATARTVELIRCHHDPHVPDPVADTQGLLAALQAVDDEN